MKTVDVEAIGCEQLAQSLRSRTPTGNRTHDLLIANPMPNRLEFLLLGYKRATVTVNCMNQAQQHKFTNILTISYGIKINK